MTYIRVHPGDQHLLLGWRLRRSCEGLAARRRPRPSPSAQVGPDQARGLVGRDVVVRGVHLEEPRRRQAVIAACHATAPSPAATDRARIVTLYDRPEVL